VAAAIQEERQSVEGNGSFEKGKYSLKVIYSYLMASIHTN
jgi:hypothetical protein